MKTVSVNQFRENLKSFVEVSINDHTPIKVTRRAGEDFIVMSADDWQREQETLHVLQSQSLMQQLAESLETHKDSKGYQPNKEELDAILNL